MRRSLLIALLVVAAAVPATALEAATAGKATLAVGSGTLHGSHFAKRELVRLTFAGPAPRVQRQVRTNAVGAFTTALPSGFDPCVESLQVIAAGARGDDARLKLPQRACPMPARSDG